MEIELPGLLIKYPGRSGEEGAPVVGRKKLFSLILHNIPGKALLLFLGHGRKRSSLTPNVVISLGIFLVLTALHKPGMLIGAVVYHQVHHNLNAFFMGLFQKSIKVSHGTELFHDIFIVGNIIAVVIVGRTIYRGKPDDINP